MRYSYTRQAYLSSRTLKRIQQGKPGADALRVDQLNTLLAARSAFAGLPAPSSKSFAPSEPDAATLMTRLTRDYRD